MKEVLFLYNQINEDRELKYLPKLWKILLANSFVDARLKTMEAIEKAYRENNS